MTLIDLAHPDENYPEGRREGESPMDRSDWPAFL